jgi:cytochrome c peroxidase
MLSSASRIIFGLLVVTGGACRSIEPIGTPPELDAQGVAQVELGHALFFDMDLSVDRTVACVSCHELDSGGAQARSVSLGVDNQEGRRNAPSVFNASFKFLQFWDGRESDFDRQALGPITALDEMGLAEDEMVARLQARPEVVAAFARAFALDSPPLSAALAVPWPPTNAAWRGRVGSTASWRVTTAP